MKEITKKIINRTVAISSYSFFILFGLLIFIGGLLLIVGYPLFGVDHNEYYIILKEVKLVIFLTLVLIIWFACKKINTSRIIIVPSIIFLSPLIYVLVIYIGTLVDPQYRHLLAKRGNAAMQFDLGWMHEIGYRVPRNPKEAIKWYQLAANKKHAGAQFALGVMYYDGKYVKQNR